jgi:outer membrane protein assembly factor BamB
VLHALRLVIGALAASAGIASAQQMQEWPEFRGPGGQGHSVERGVPSIWNENRNILWKSPVPGLGWSSPTVSGGRIWLTTATGTREVSLRALAFDVETGREVVNVEVFRVRNPDDINPKNSWASPTPVIEEDRVYVHFGTLGTAALSTTGEILWTARFRYKSQHGSGGSPVVYDDLLILSCDGSDMAFVVALDKRTGKVRWKRDRAHPSDQAYTTPLVIRVDERDQVVSVGAYRAVAYEPRSGREIWQVEYPDGFSNVPRPVYGHGLVYIATGFQQPTLMAVRPGLGDVTRRNVAWTLRRGAPLTPSPLLVGDLLYVLTDGGILSCVEAVSGTVLWQQRLGGTYSASPVFADGRIYFQSEQGITTVIAEDRAYRAVSINPLYGGMLATMAVSGGSIYIRSDTHLYRIATPAS